MASFRLRLMFTGFNRSSHNLFCLIDGSNVIGSNLFRSRSISSGEVFTALKPFFFAVHPDLFGQFPKEREVNENSLKQLNAYIELATNSKPTHPVNLTFYIRQNGKTNSHIAESKEYASKFQAVNIDLGQRDVRRTVYTILEKCNLPTSFVDSIPVTRREGIHRLQFNSYPPPQPQPSSFWRKCQQDYYEQAERELNEKKLTQDNLIAWLNRNVDDAKTKLVDCFPIREEVLRLKTTICKTLNLKDLLWECGWSATSFRGCLESFQILTTQHSEVMTVLKDRTVVFGRETGVSMDGHVVLNSGEVRTNWLDIIKNVSKHDAVILRIPAVQKALSRSLKDIKVVHRKFQPNKLAENYELQLRKLTTSLGDYRGKSNFPKNWPDELSDLELVVEADAGPLMVSPTGQIIVPSSCPPFLLVNFISENLEEAKLKLHQYKRQKYEEIELHSKCQSTLGLIALDKADNVTPNLMIDCCSRLLSHSSSLTPILRGCHLWITTYYSVLSEGELCIPWNWKLDVK